MELLPADGSPSPRLAAGEPWAWSVVWRVEALPELLLAPIPPGSYRLRVAGPGGRVHAADVTVAAGGVTRTRFRLE